MALLKYSPDDSGCMDELDDGDFYRVSDVDPLLAELEEKVQGYYNQASEGWTKFRDAERKLAEKDKELVRLNNNLLKLDIEANQRIEQLKAEIERLDAINRRREDIICRLEVEIERLTKDRDEANKTIVECGFDRAKQRIEELEDVIDRILPIAIDRAHAIPLDDWIGALRIHKQIVAKLEAEIERLTKIVNTTAYE